MHLQPHLDRFLPSGMLGSLGIFVCLARQRQDRCCASSLASRPNPAYERQPHLGLFQSTLFHALLLIRTPRSTLHRIHLGGTRTLPDLMRKWVAGCSSGYFVGVPTATRPPLGKPMASISAAILTVCSGHSNSPSQSEGRRITPGWDQRSARAPSLDDT